MEFSSINFGDFFAGSNDLMCIIDFEGNIKTANPAFDTILSLNTENYIDTPLLDLVHPLDKENTEEHITKVINNSKRGHSFENRILTIQQDFKWICWSSFCILQEQYVFCIAHDITVNKLNEHKVAQTNHRVHQIINLVPHPIFLKDAKGEYLLVNEAQARLFSALPEELIGKDDSYFIVNAEEHKIVLESDLDVIANLKSVDLLSQNITNVAGIRKILHTTKIPLVDSVDGSVGILGVSIDLTEIRTAEDELKKANDELDNFVHKTSHDLKAPLKSIIGLLDLLIFEGDLSLKNNYAERAKRSVRTLDGFISDLTNLSRNSRSEVEKAKIDFHKMVSYCKDSLMFMDNAFKINIQFEIFDEEPFYSDEARIKILFMNFISNAIKYQNENIVNPYLKIKINVSKTQSRIIFRDNGIGISDDYQAKIYEMFFRASDASFGSGLGLYIVKQTIEKLNGQIKLDSKVNEGSTFTITIPNALPEYCQID
ncbi:MAG TPA: PAS domain-containing sensor histidine kinase [Cytophagaceae bacterium]|jgi:hypothetical protein